jgi:hypothetical protein
LGFQPPVDNLDDAEVAVCIGSEVRVPPHVGIGVFDNITVADGLQYLDCLSRISKKPLPRLSQTDINLPSSLSLMTGARRKLTGRRNYSRTVAIPLDHTVLDVLL